MGTVKSKRILFVSIILVIAFVILYKGFSGSPKLDNDTIAIAILGEPASLDPNFVTGSWESKIINDTFTGLIQKDLKGNIVPGMAERWSISSDGYVYTFYLRDSKWSDGVPVTAGDFEFGIKRLLNPQTAATYASFTYVIKGAQNYSEGGGKAEDVGIKAIDDRTLQITLEYPISYFIDMLAHYTFFPLPQHVVEKYGRDWSKPNYIVNNGAYAITQWKPQSFVKVKRNPYFYDNENTSVENVIYYTQEDRAAILKRYRAGEIDIITDFSSEQYGWLMSNIADQVKVAPYEGIYYLSINLDSKDSPALRNKNVRVALSMLIDREFITEKVLKSGEIPAYSFVPANLDGYTPSYFKWRGLSKEERVAKAKDLLQQEGYDPTNPIRVEIGYNTSENHKRIVVAIASMWKEAGVIATSFNSEVAVHYKNMQGGDYQIGRAGWIADYPEPSAILYVAETGVGNNYAKYSNPKYDDFMNMARKTLSKTARFQYYREAEAILLDDMPYLPIYYYVSKNIVSPRISGWEPNTSDTHLSRYIKILDE